MDQPKIPLRIGYSLVDEGADGVVNYELVDET